MKKHLCICLAAVICFGILFSGCTKEENIEVFSSSKQIQKQVTETIKNAEHEKNDSFPTLDFISEKKAMFHTQNDFFVFDLKKKKIVSAVNLKKIDFFSKKGDVDARIQVSEDGRKVWFSQTKGKKSLKNICFNVEKQEISKVSEKPDKIYRGDFYEHYKKDTFAGKSVESLKKKLDEAGQTEQHVLIAGERTLAYLAYPTDLYMEAEGSFKNLGLALYDVSSGKTENIPLFRTYAKIDDSRNPKELSSNDGKVWMKRGKNGWLYYDVDAMNGTEAATGKFGKLVVGNVFCTGTGKLTVTIHKPEDFDVSLAPVLSLNQVEEKEEPQIYEIKKNRKTYTFTGLKPGEYYYIDYYAQGDVESDEQLKKADDHNAKISVTISN